MQSLQDKTKSAENKYIISFAFNCTLSLQPDYKVVNVFSTFPCVQNVHIVQGLAHQLYISKTTVLGS